VFNATFAALCLITFCRLAVLGLEAVGQRLDPDRAVIECRIVGGDPWWRKFSGLKAAAAEELPDAVRWWTRSMSFVWPATPSTGAGCASSRTLSGIVAAPAIRC